MVFDDIIKAFPEDNIPDLSVFYNRISSWSDIYKGEPEWLTVKSSGLYKKAKRKSNTLNIAKVLCDKFSALCFAEQAEIACDEPFKSYIDTVLDDEGFWKNIPDLLSKAYAHGGCVMREYLDNDKVKINYIEAADFIPIAWDNKRITAGIFRSQTYRNGIYYTLLERHKPDDGRIRVDSRLYRSSDKNSIGTRCAFSELYPDAPDYAVYDTDVPVFQYFKPACANNKDSYIPLGISVFANAADTLRALDTAFDSLAREVVLGKKRIIVPSSCIQTVVDTASGKIERYFDTDDEVFQALKCDEERDLKITDNTVTLRIDEHVKLINALLNILCAQVGLSVGALSFDMSSGVKTATEVVSEQNETMQTMRANKNLLVEFFEGLCRAIIALGVSVGKLPNKEYSLAVGFKDNVIIDENTLIDNNIKLVAARLQSKADAIMEIFKCDESEAQKKLARINKEQDISADMTDMLALRGGTDDGGGAA